MFGYPRIHHPSVTSTNDVAKELAHAGTPEGTVVTADFQTRGRGRSGNEWISPPGENLLASYVIHPSRDPVEWGGLALLAGVAIRDVLHSVAQVEASLMWPNDVLVSGRKIAGVLIDTILGIRPTVIVGIGINVNTVRFTSHFRIEPTSLSIETGKKWDVEMIEQGLSAALEKCYTLWSTDGMHRVIDEWKKRSELIGCGVTFREGAIHGGGTVIDVGEDGCLVLQLESGELKNLYAADVSNIVHNG